MATPYPTHSEGIPVAYVTIHDDLLCPSCADAREYGDIKGGKHILITDTGHVCTDCWTDLEPLPEPDPTMYFVLWGDYNEWFACQLADDATHAVEQTLDAYPGEGIHAVMRAVPDYSWKVRLYRAKERTP